MSTFLIWAGVWLILGLVFVFLWAGIMAIDKARENSSHFEERSRSPRPR